MYFLDFSFTIDALCSLASTQKLNKNYNFYNVQVFISLFWQTFSVKYVNKNNKV